MKTLHINIADKKATYQKRDGEIVCGNKDYQISFVFDAEWDAIPTKIARFIWNGQHIDIPIGDNICAAPEITNADSVKIGVYTVDEEGTPSLYTTTSAVIPCQRSIRCEGSVPRPEEESVQIGEALVAASEARFYATEAKVAAESAAAAVEEAKAVADPLLKYPVGAIYESREATSPAALFGGEWEQLRSKFLLGADTDALTNPIPTYKGTTEGGSADAVVVEHRHQGLYWGDITPNSYITLNTQGGAAYGLSYGDSDNSNVIFTGREGEDGTGKNMPPYLVVYRWSRTA